MSRWEDKAPAAARSGRRNSRLDSRDAAVRRARTCYDHLAGELGVRLREALETSGFLIDNGTENYEVSRDGEVFLRELGIDVDQLRRLRRNFACKCPDWTERRDHIAGGLGAALYARFLALRWIEHDARSRAVYVSESGRLHLNSLFALRMEDSRRIKDTQSHPVLRRQFP